MRRALLLVVAATALGCGSPIVTRSVGGRVVAHRVISVEAYAAYARGAVAEADGDFQLAFKEYSDASESDASGVQPWTRKGAVACRLALFKEADAAFARAESNDASFPLLWVERARCALDRGEVDVADTLSTRALAAEPDDDDVSLVRAEVLEKQGRSADAINLLLGLSLRRESVRALEALVDLAGRASDDAARRYAEARLASLRADVDGPETTVLARVDWLVSRGDADGAELVGRRIGLSRSDIAVRAAALGKLELAHTIAGPIVRADPRDADAAIAELAALEALDRPALASTLDAFRGRKMRAPSPLAALLLAELVRREGGPDSAEPARGIAPAPDPKRQDPLEDAVRARSPH
ncbi:MAG: hypothetical protein U0414_28145 [Polyangiaceae bacterium]